MFVFEYKSKRDCDQSFPFIKHLRKLWDEVHSKPNVFRYNVDNLEQKVEGPFVFDLNPYRNAKRRKPEEMAGVCQAFDINKFNFCKASPEEVLFQFWNESKPDDIHKVLVNVSPINRYHSLLCPSVNAQLPQMATLENLQLVLDIYFLAGDRNLRIGFNSLCAMASVNHLHYHLFLVEPNLPIENVEFKHLKGPVWVTQNYPIPAFCFEVSDNTKAKDIYKIIEYFFQKSIAHNIFVSRGRCFESDLETTKVFLWARKFSTGAKQLNQLNAGVCELAGWFPVYSVEDYESIDVQFYEAELVKWKLDSFDEICEDVKLLF